MDFSQSKGSSGTNDTDCKVHLKAISHRCLTCKTWACKECLERHTKLMGCSTITSNEAMKKIKNEHTKDIDQLLTTFEENSNLKNL